MFLLCMKIVLAFVLALLPLAAQVVTTEPVGFNKVTCLANSDTIVGVPLRVQGSITTKLAAVPTLNGELATLSLASSALPAFSKHYLKFIGGTRDGRWYDITANTATSVTIDLNGDNLNGVISGDSVLIAEYWTLNSLFPPAGATTSWTETPVGSGNWVPNGHAIVPWPNGLNRRTEVLLPNITAQGINIASAGTYYITGGVWKKFGDTSKPNFGDTILYPDNYFSLRHPSTVAHNTIFRSLGEVENKNFTIFLSTRTTGKQDNFIGLPRPTPIKLKHLGLNDDAVFVASASALNRKDELLVFDNETAIRNKAPTVTYYRLSTGWRKFGDASTNQDDTTIPAGAGFIIRKSISDGSSDVWQNPLILIP